MALRRRDAGGWGWVVRARALRLGVALALSRLSFWLDTVATREASTVLDNDAYCWDGDITFPVRKQHQAFDDPNPWDWLAVSETGIAESLRMAGGDHA